MLCEILILYDISKTNAQFAMFLSQGLINILYLLLTCVCTFTDIPRISHVLKPYYISWVLPHFNIDLGLSVRFRYK